MSTIFVVAIVVHIDITLFVPNVSWHGWSKAGVRRTFPSFAECCSQHMFFPFHLQEHVSTHMPHILNVAIEVGGGS